MAHNELIRSGYAWVGVSAQAVGVNALKNGATTAARYGSLEHPDPDLDLAEWGRITSYRQGQLDKLKTVEVHTAIGEMSADDVLAYGADKVIVATVAYWSSDGYGAVTMAPLPGAHPIYCEAVFHLMTNQ